MATSQGSSARELGFPPPLLPPFGQCQLCGKTGQLELGHIIPAFVFRRKMETSATGYMRPTYSPNRRVQDGLKDYILCRSCEARFSEWERAFSQNIFEPGLKHDRASFRYGRWMAKFAASVTWRVLTFRRLHPELQHKVITDWSDGRRVGRLAGLPK